MANEKRVVFLDKLRVLATLAVVMLHTVSGAVDYLSLDPTSFENCFSTLVLDLVSWCVPVFLMISGYLFLDPGRRLTYREVVNKYCRRIVLALLVFGIPYAVLELIAGGWEFGISMIVEAVRMVLGGESWAHLWYLYLILVLYVLTPPLRLVLQKIPGWLVWCITLMLPVGCCIFPFVELVWAPGVLPCLPDNCIYLFYYLCGYLFRIRRREGGSAYFGVFAVLAALAIGISLFTRISCLFLLRTAYAYPTTVMLALGIFGMGANLRDKKRNTEGLDKAAALSFTVYLIHPVFINFLYKYLGVTPYSFHLWWSIPVFFVAILAASLLGAALLRRISPLRRWVL